MIFGPTSIVLAARLQCVRGPQFKLIIWLVLKRYESTTLESSLSGMRFFIIIIIIRDP